MIFTLLNHEELSWVDHSVWSSTRELKNFFKFGISHFISVPGEGNSLFRHGDTFACLKHGLDHVKFLTDLCQQPLGRLTFFKHCELCKLIKRRPYEFELFN